MDVVVAAHPRPSHPQETSPQMVIFALIYYGLEIVYFAVKLCPAFARFCAPRHAWTCASPGGECADDELGRLRRVTVRALAKWRQCGCTV